jgi:hypothetical protein
VRISVQETPPRRPDPPNRPLTKSQHGSVGTAASAVQPSAAWRGSTPAANNSLQFPRTKRTVPRSKL